MWKVGSCWPIRKQERCGDNMDDYMFWVWVIVMMMLLMIIFLSD